MKDRLSYTKEGKLIPYNSLTAEQKQKVSNADYTAKINLKRHKKNMELMQTLS
jgi:hypothetical protein